MIDPVALRAELDNDPASLGYAPFMASGNNTALVALLNETHAADQVSRGLIPSHEIIEATVAVDWAALTDPQQRQYMAITGAGQVNASAVNVRDAFLAMFAGGTATRANLAALEARDGSRVEVLFGAGSVASLFDVREARKV